MAIETATERAIFFDTDEFGSAATYTPSGGSAATVNGIFDNEFVGVEMGTGAVVESARPVFACREADVSSVAHGDTLVVDSVTYNIRGVEPDGTGMTRLILEVA